MNRKTKTRRKKPALPRKDVQKLYALQRDNRIRISEIEGRLSDDLVQLHAKINEVLENSRCADRTLVEMQDAMRARARRQYETEVATEKAK